MEPFGGAHRKRLKAHLRLQLNQPPTFQSLKKKLEPLADSARRAVAAFLAHLAQVDGEVSPAEVKLLERVYKTLQLDSQSLYSDLHVVASGNPAGSLQATPAAPGATQSKTIGGFALDHDRIAQLQRETEQVSALLAQVFVGEQPVEPEEVSIEEAGEDTSGVCGLDADLSAFLRVLVSRNEWTRDELEAVASDMELMLDGALEQINDMAFEHFDMPVTEVKILRNQSRRHGKSTAMSSIRAKDRDAVIQSLRAGVVPRAGQHLIQVGRAGELEALIRDVERLAERLRIQVVIGEYGAGKTFFLNLVRSIAMERKLVTMHADLNPDRRLHATGGQARSLYAELAKNMATRTKPDGGALQELSRGLSLRLRPRPRHPAKTAR